MPERASEMLKIGFVGDTWLKKVCDVFAQIYDLVDPVFVSETAPQDEIDAATSTCNFIVGTWFEGASYDVICPRFNIDGLCTIEMSGAGPKRSFLGSAPLVERIDQEKDMKLIVAALNGDIEFNCIARFEASLDALKLQETTAVTISDLLIAKYQSEPILTGFRKPTPTVTVEMARRIADRLSLNPNAFDNIDHFLRGHLAIKASKRCILPFDAQKLGLKYESDPFWFPTFGALFKDIAADARKAKK